MKPGDGILAELARKAGVRPPHIYHIWAYRRQLRAAFSPEGYAEFARIDLKHVLAMVAVLDAQPEPITRQKRGQSLLTAAWAIPEAWLLWAQTERGWPRDVTETVAAKFKDYWVGRGKAMADWQATWRNWVRSDYAPPSAVRAEAKRDWTDAERAAYLERLKP